MTGDERSQLIVRLHEVVEGCADSYRHDRNEDDRCEQHAYSYSNRKSAHDCRLVTVLEGQAVPAPSRVGQSASHE